MCVCEREIINDVDDIVAAASVDVAVVAARDAIVDVDLAGDDDDVALVADAALVVDPMIDAAWGEAPPKAD